MLIIHVFVYKSTEVRINMHNIVYFHKYNGIHIQVARTIMHKCLLKSQLNDHSPAIYQL